MYRIKPLPNWCLTGTRPAFYDTESADTIEQTAKLYGVIQELVNDYNKYVDEINKTISDFIGGITKDQKEFEDSINKIMHDYIIMLDEKLKLQDLEIAEAINFMKTNLQSSIYKLLGEMQANGELNGVILNAFDNFGTRLNKLENTEYTLAYEEGTENLILQKTIKEGE